MTPNPNPSPELRALVQSFLISLTGGGRNAANTLSINHDELAKLVKDAEAALSQQTLPAPGEDRTDAQLLRLIAKDHARLAPNAYHTAETLVQIADRIEALATVAAANDEGFVRGIEAAAKVADDYEQHTGDPAFDAATDVAAVTIAERIRLLSQGEGK